MRVNNLGIDVAELPIIYLVTGLCTVVAGPLIGKAADRIGKMPVFLAGSVTTSVMVVTYTHLGPVPLAVFIAINVLLSIRFFHA